MSITQGEWAHMSAVENNGRDQAKHLKDIAESLAEISRTLADLATETARLNHNLERETA